MALRRASIYINSPYSTPSTDIAEITVTLEVVKFQPVSVTVLPQIKLNSVLFFQIHALQFFFQSYLRFIWPYVLKPMGSGRLKWSKGEGENKAFSESIKKKQVYTGPGWLWHGQLANVYLLWPKRKVQVKHEGEILMNRQEERHAWWGGKENEENYSTESLQRRRKWMFMSTNLETFRKKEP